MLRGLALLALAGAAVAARADARIAHAAVLRVPENADTVRLEAALPYQAGATALEIWRLDPARRIGEVRVEPTGAAPGRFREQSFPLGKNAGPAGPARIELRLAPGEPSPDGAPLIRQLAFSREGPRDPFIKTDGIYLRNNRGRGDIVRPRGVNLGGWLLQESFMSPLQGGWDEYRARETLSRRFGPEKAEILVETYQDAWITEEDFARMAAAGLNCVRLPVHWQNHMREDGSFKRLADGSADFTRIDWAVRAARRHGLYTLLDLHGAPGSQNGRDHSGDRRGPLLWESAHYRSMTANLWRELARRYRDEPAVLGYDLLNEPARDARAKRWDDGIIAFVSELYATVRAVDPDHVVFFSVWSEVDHVADLPAGKSNFALAYHWYLYRRYIEEGGTEPGFWSERLARNAALSRDRHEAPFFLGEFSFRDSPEAWAPRMELITRHGVGWAKWAYKTRAAGGWGLYEARNANDANIPDLERDDYDVIRRKWASWRTDAAFHPDPNVIGALRNAARLDPSGPVVFPD